MAQRAKFTLELSKELVDNWWTFTQFCVHANVPYHNILHLRKRHPKTGPQAACFELLMSWWTHLPFAQIEEKLTLACAQFPDGSNILNRLKHKYSSMYNETQENEDL